MFTFENPATSTATSAAAARPSVFARLWRRLAALPPWQRDVFIGLAAPAALCMVFAAGEIALRAEQYYRFGSQGPAVESVVNRNVWESVGERRRPRPNAVLGRIQFSDQGFRGKAVAIPKPEGTVRIAFLGASGTFDLFVTHDNETWPAVAMARLGAAYPRCRFDFVNAGVLGDITRAVESRFVEDTQPYAPDIAVVMLNDIFSMARRHLNLGDGEYRPSWLAKHSHLWRTVEKNMEAEQLLRIAGRRDLAKRIDLPVMLADVGSEAGHLLATTKEQGVLPVVVEKAPWLRREQSADEQLALAGATNLAGTATRAVYVPQAYTGDVTEAFYSYNARLREAAAAHAAPFIATVERMPARPNYYADTVHTTAAGSAILGAIVGDGLAANTAVARLIAERGKGCNAAR